MLVIILWTFYLFSLVTTGWDPAFPPIKHIVSVYLFSKKKKKKVKKMFTKKNILNSCVNWSKGKEAVFTVGDFSPQWTVKFQSYKRWEQKICIYTVSRHKVKAIRHNKNRWKKKVLKEQNKKHCTPKQHFSHAEWQMGRTLGHVAAESSLPASQMWSLPQTQLDFPEGFPWKTSRCEWGQGRCHRSFPHSLALHKTLPNGN